MIQSRDPTVAQEMRLLAGFVVQPFAAAMLGFIAFPLIDLTLEGGGTTDPIGAAISIALGAGLAAIFVTVCGAFPVVVWFLKRGPLRLRQILWGGVVLGNLPFAVIVLLAIVTNNVSAGTSLLGLLRSLAFGALFGVVGAALFWAISIRGTDMEKPVVSGEGRPMGLFLNDR